MTSSRATRGVAPPMVAAALVVAILATNVGIAPGAALRPEGSGELDGGTLGVGIETAHTAQPVPIDAGSASLPRLIHYTSEPIPAVELGDLGGLCDANPRSGTDLNQVIFGWFYRVIGSTSDGRVVSDELVCVPHPTPNDVAPASPTLPVSPTIGDVWRAVALPRPVVGANPVSRGVTGLETRMWSGGAEAVRVAITIGEYRIAGTAAVVEYRFFTDEGFAGASTTPGDAASPAATHTFVAKGPHTLSVASVWRANVTMVGPGVTGPIPLDINTAVLSATVAYPVVEVRTRLVA